MLDAKSLIEIKNKNIIDLGGSPVIFDIPQEVGNTEGELLDRVTASLKALYPFRNSEKAGAKYRTLSRVFKLKSGVTFDEYKEKGEKFLHGGALGNYTNNAIENLTKTNQVILLRETDKDSVLKYTTPDNSVLLEFILPATNVAYGLAYSLDKSTVIDFFMNESLTQSLNFTFTFSPSFDENTFKAEYLDMMKHLSEVEAKFY